MCTINNNNRPCVATAACQVPVGNGICGETSTLDIINEFKLLYEGKMRQIDNAGGGDNLEEKVRLQQGWIGDLSEQNEMLVRAVEDLEHEATERVKILEEQLHHSAQCLSEVMKRYREYDVTNNLLGEPLQKTFCLESDQKNLLEFIRRVREENRWDVKGLSFFDISYQDLFGSGKTEKNHSKNKCTNSDNSKEQAKLKDREYKINDLLHEINYYKSFGNIEVMAKDLQRKVEECESLKSSSEDARQALIEEIASKHDTILQLKRDCQQLEERCIQADKQTAFRDDIIKELRKEIKQLKQQLTQEEIIRLNCTIDDLQTNLQQTRQLQEEEEKRNQAKIGKLNSAVVALTESLKSVEEKYERDVKVCKICKGRAKVGFVENAEVQVYCDQKERERQMEMLSNKEEIIKVQNETLNIMQQELHTLKQKEFELRKDKECKNEEVQQLKHRISELEGVLEDCDGKAANLQLAVDLYLNSINVLEASEEKYKIEIDQQKSTISNLQKALVATKQELDELKQKSEDNEQLQHTLVDCFNVILSNVEVEKENLSQQYDFITEEYRHLQDLNFDLEVDHCNSLQDVDILENQLFKYQSLLKCSEEEIKNYKLHFKKLIMQKKCYEEVILYFKEEMSLMSEQLCNLQELLTLSNQTTREENCKLMQAFNHVQSLNDTLSSQLAAAHQKVELENQMNQLQETKIYELQQLISERDLDLTQHDKAIMNIRQSLQCSLQQNAELQETISTLSSTIVVLQDAIKKYEVDNCRSRESTQQCQDQISTCRDKLDDLKNALDKKTGALRKLEIDYTNQTRALKEAQLELKEMKDRQNDKQCHLKCTIEELNEKLVRAEQNLTRLSEDFAKVQAQLATVSRREAVKDNEVKQYRKIVCDLKNTLIDLNRSLLSRDMQDLQKLQSKCKNADCKKNVKNVEDLKNQDICLNCPCEVEFYQSIVETLKRAVIDLKKKLADTQKRNQQLEEESKRKEEQLAELSQSHMAKDKEYQDLRRKLTEKLKQAQAEEARYLEMAAQFDKELGTIRQELEIKTTQLNEVKKSAQEINSSRCVQLACAQEEVNNLKEELNGLLRKHRAINSENEKLHSQSARMQSTVVTLEEKSQLLKGQLEQYLLELQSVQNEKEVLMRKNRELLSELRSIQCSYSSSAKQDRSVKALESELHDLRNNRDEISIESKNVINYVRGWLQEQKKINEHIVRRERNYCDTIQRLRQENEDLQTQCVPQSQRPRVMAPCIKPFAPPMCQSPWSLGSQGTASIRDADSPSPTPCLEDQCDWYSPTYRNDSDDEDEEDWVSKVENLAEQVRKTNKMWKNKMGQSDYTVSRDTKK